MNTVVGAVTLVAGFLQYLCWQMAAYNQGQRIRQHLIRAVLRQDITWFETHNTGELNSRLAR